MVSIEVYHIDLDHLVRKVAACVHAVVGCRCRLLEEDSIVVARKDWVACMMLLVEEKWVADLFQTEKCAAATGAAKDAAAAAAAASSVDGDDLATNWPGSWRIIFDWRHTKGLTPAVRSLSSYEHFWLSSSYYFWLLENDGWCQCVHLSWWWCVVLIAGKRQWKWESSLSPVVMVINSNDLWTIFRF